MLSLIYTKLSTIRATCMGAQQLRRPSAVAVRGVATLFDQLIVSATNFLTTLVIGRACLPDELGLYSVGFSLAVVLMNIPKALIWTPYTTFLPGMPADERRTYSGSTLLLQILLSAFAAVAILAVGVSLMPWIGVRRLTLLLVTLGPAMGAMFFREHLRRICFARLQLAQALAADVAVAALQGAGVLLLAKSGGLTAGRAYLVITAASMPVVLAWLLATRHTYTLKRDHLKADWRKNWRYARWIFAASLPAAANDALYPWALAWFYGATSVGMLSAANSVILLTNPLLLGVGNFFGPHAAHVYADHGIDGLYRLVTKAAAVLMLFMSAFTLMVAVWGGWFITVMFGGNYNGQQAIVTALAVAQLGDVVAIPLTLGLFAVGRNDLYLKTILIRTVLSATVGIWCVDQFGAVGVGYGQIVSNFGASIWLWFAFRSLANEMVEART